MSIPARLSQSFTLTRPPLWTTRRMCVTAPICPPFSSESNPQLPLFRHQHSAHTAFATQTHHDPHTFLD